MREKLSVIIITFNEEKNIIECLESVKWADEIVIVDAESQDQTIKLARKYTDKIIVRKWDNFSSAKSFALKQTTNNWILSIDADERVTPELMDEILEILSCDSDKPFAYDIARKSYFLKKWIKHCGWYPNYVTRLFRKDKARYSSSSVHERVIVEGKTGVLKNYLIHFTDDSLWHYFNKFNYYTTLSARDMSIAGKTIRIDQLIFRPIFTFIRMYFFKLGFLDGIHGFILCTLSSFYVFTKYAKLWENYYFKNKGLKE